MNDKPFGHLAVETSKVVRQRGAVYHGGILRAPADQSVFVAVYDGLDADGDLIDFFYGYTARGDHHVLERGIDVREGLYVDLGDNVSAFTVYYEPPVGEER